MKNILLILTLFSMAISAFAQMSIGNSIPHTSAILDLNVSSLTPKKGFLVPRVNLTANNDVSTIPSPANGLMVFNLTSANSDALFVKGKTFNSFDGSKWQRLTTIPEVYELKQPMEFVQTSKAQQIFSSGEITTVNSGNVIPIEWGEGDIYISNENDVEFIESSHTLRVKTASYYDFSGMVNFRANVATMGDSSQVILVLQKSTDGGSTWVDVMASSTPMELFATGRVYTIALPNFIHYLNVNEQVRMAIKKPNYSTANNYTTNSGIAASNPTVDVTKSVRVVRLEQ